MTELRNNDLVFEAFHEENTLWVALNLADAPLVRAIPAAVDKLAGDVAVRRKGTATEITLTASRLGNPGGAVGIGELQLTRRKSFAAR